MSRASAIILVVDDEIMNRRILQASLEHYGYHPRLVDSGQAALDYINEWQVDLVLLDITMPGMDGYEVLSLIRAQQSRANLPVIMATSLSSSEEVTRALSQGANDYITKPYDVEVMIARIQTQLSLKNARDALEKSIERFDLAVQGTSDGIWDWNLETNEIYYSPRWKKILGYEPDMIKNVPREWFERIHPEDKTRLEEALDAHLRGREPKLECEYRLLHRDETYRWVLTRGTALTKKDGSAYRLVGGQTDITQNKLYDPQTGLYSRSLFEDRLSQTLILCKQDEMKKGVVLLLGLEQFGFVRNSLGDLMEDELLIQIGTRLKQCISTEDCLARVGGDNFALLLPLLVDGDALTALLAKVRRTLKRPFTFNDFELFIHIGIGIVMLGPSFDDSKTVIRSGYAALEEAKRVGQDKDAVFDQKLHEESLEALRLEAEMRKGIRRNEFELYYQPIVSLKQDRVAYCEALIRWNHPRHGFLAPARFIDLAEQTGLILEMGDWVLNQACRQGRIWYDQGFAMGVSVNFSAQQFHQKQMVDRVCHALQVSGLPPALLKVELTESTLIEDMAGTINKVVALRELGIRIALDDFGTGYSSLNYLKRVPFDILKIDQSFVRGVTTDIRDAAITQAIIQLAESLSLEIIAEGVETVSHLHFLKKLGCDLFQGYLISRPINAESFTQNLEADTFMKDARAYLSEDPVLEP